MPKLWRFVDGSSQESAPPEKAVEKEAPIKQLEVKEPQSIPDKLSGEGWYQEPEKKKTDVSPILLSVLLAVVILGVGGFFVYNNVIKPRQIDKAAPRYYTFVDFKADFRQSGFEKGASGRPFQR